MIVGTAGHVDHGKTTLVRALTGVDTDRLPEEKRRGMTIELGFAYLDAPGGLRLGFVDVPGHERFVGTMLAGAAGIDFALLVVAADDGVMPQTREHLAALTLFGVQRGAVALTKCDRVDAAAIAARTREIRALLAGSPLAAAPVVPTSVPARAGIETLRALLLGTATPVLVDEAQAFRLAVDRAFVLDGLGWTAAGYVRAGTVQVGDDLVVLPEQTPVRVRSIHADGKAARSAARGQRAALALHGIEAAPLRRGQWLVAPEAALVTERVDVLLRALPELPVALRRGCDVSAHAGAAAWQGRLVPLDGETLEPGRSARAQLVLHEPGAAWAGDRIVLRAGAAARIVGGATVLDPCAPKRYRRTPARRAVLDALAIAAPALRTAAVLDAATDGLDADAYAHAQAREVVPPPGTVVAGRYWLGAAAAVAASQAILAALQAFHAALPDHPGPDIARLRRIATPRLAVPLHRKLVDALRAQGCIAGHGPSLRLPQHAVALDQRDESLARRIAPRLDAAGRRGAWVRDLAAQLGEPESTLRAGLAAMRRASLAWQITTDLYASPQVVDELAALVRALAFAHGGAVTTRAFRDASGVGRNRAVQILEFFDDNGLLRRARAQHHLRPDCERFIGEAPPGGAS